MCSTSEFLFFCLLLSAQFSNFYWNPWVEFLKLPLLLTLPSRILIYIGAYVFSATALHLNLAYLTTALHLFQYLTRYSATFKIPLVYLTTALHLFIDESATALHLSYCLLDTALHLISFSLLDYSATLFYYRFNYSATFILSFYQQRYIHFTVCQIQRYNYFCLVSYSATFILLFN